MLYMIHCVDQPDSLDVRKANRDAHLAHLKAHGDHLYAAGPLLGDDGETMIGSLLLIDFPGRAAVDAFLAADPYNKAGLFARVEVAPWKKLLP